MKALEERTSSWTNIPAMTYTLSDDSGENKYSPITRTNVRARLLTYSEAHALGCGIESQKCPDYLYYVIESHWLSTASTGTFPTAQRINYFGDFAVDFPVSVSSNGIRPVITLSKTM